MTFRLVVAPLRGPGRSPVLPFACCVGSLLSVGRCGRCSCWCRFSVRPVVGVLGLPPPLPPPPDQNCHLHPPGGYCPHTAHTAAFKSPGWSAMLQNTAPGLGTERRGDLQRHMRIRAHGRSRAHMPRCTMCTVRAAPSRSCMISGSWIGQVQTHLDLPTLAAGCWQKPGQEEQPRGRLRISSSAASAKWHSFRVHSSFSERDLTDSVCSLAHCWCPGHRADCIWPYSSFW